VNGFKKGFHQWNQRIFLVVVENFFPKIFFWFSEFGCTLPPCSRVAGKPFVLEDLCLDMGTSVASALTAETVFEIIKGTCPHACAWGQNSQILRFFNSGYAHDRNISIFRRRASCRVTMNTLIKSNYASVRQSRDSLHTVTRTTVQRKKSRKKSRRRRALKALELRSSKSAGIRVLRHTTMPVRLV